MLGTKGGWSSWDPGGSHCTWLLQLQISYSSSLCACVARPRPAFFIFLFFCFLFLLGPRFFLGLTHTHSNWQTDCSDKWAHDLTMPLVGHYNTRIGSVPSANMLIAAAPNRSPKRLRRLGGFLSFWEVYLIVRVQIAIEINVSRALIASLTRKLPYKWRHYQT